jgi:hypothetical protein
MPGQFYFNTAVGELPSPFSLDFVPALIDLLEIREADVPLARATNYFIDSSSSVTENSGCSPSDSHDGLDGLGLALSGATYTGSTLTLFASNAFANLTLAPYNNLIYLTGSGWTSGLYQITSKIDSSHVTLSPTAYANVTSLAAPGSGSFTLASSSGPWLSYTNLQTKLGVSGAINTRFRFRCGGIWYAGNSTNSLGFFGSGGVSLQIPASYFTIDSYGIGPKPWHKHWSSSAVLSSATWVQNGTYATVWSISSGTFNASTSNFVWLRDKFTPFPAYMMINNQGSDSANLALCATTPRSFCLTSSFTTLNINPGNEIGAVGTPINPNNAEANLQLEFNTQGQNALFNIYTDNVRIEDQFVDGWAQYYNYSNNTSTALYSWVAGPSLVGGLPMEEVVKGVDSLYTAYHACGDESNGGIITCINCSGGYMTPYPTQGETVFIEFDASGNGNNSEHFNCNCWAKYGTLPSDYWIGAGNRMTANASRGQAFFSHTLSGTIGLGIRMNCTIGCGQPYPPQPPQAWGATAGGTLITQARGFVIGETCQGPLWGNSLGIGGGGATNTVSINNKYFVFADNSGSPNVTAGGWHINNIIVVDGTYSGTLDFPNPLTGIGTTSASSFINCDITFQNVGTYNTATTFFASSESGFVQPVVENCILEATNQAGVYTNNWMANPMSIGVTNGSTNLINNAYAGQITGTQYSADTGAVTIAAPVPPGPPTKNSPLFAAGASIGLEYDANGQRRPVTPTIGPFEPAGAGGNSNGAFYNPPYSLAGNAQGASEP